MREREGSESRGAQAEADECDGDEPHQALQRPFSEQHYQPRGQKKYRGQPAPVGALTAEPLTQDPANLVKESKSFKTLISEMGRKFEGGAHAARGVRRGLEAALTPARGGNGFVVYNRRQAV